MIKGLLTFLLITTSSFALFAQKVWMIPNKGQWDERIQYSVDLNGGKLYVENQGMTYFLSDAMSHNHHDGEETTHEKTKYHAVKHIFPNANKTVEIQESDSSSHYLNYMIGSDQSKMEIIYTWCIKISVAFLF